MLALAFAISAGADVGSGNPAPLRRRMSVPVVRMPMRIALMSAVRDSLSPTAAKSVPFTPWESPTAVEVAAQ